MKTSISTITTLIALFTGLTSLSHGHPNHHAEDERESSEPLRIWTDASGEHRIEAPFVSSLVALQKKDGTKLNLSLNRLGKEDQVFVEAQKNPPVRRPAAGSSQAPVSAIPFKAFGDKLKLRWDKDYLYVESNGMPDHGMMEGITAWQQQVPLPQPYIGDNAWRIPLGPVPAKQPMSAKNHFFRGAIALAANGVPIFNPIKNDGRTDTLLAGELDKWGGHCGRGDDYHYHVAPVHLEATVGKGNPVAYALDGYPIYGYLEPDGSVAKGLDWLNGHKDSKGHYHYHATKTYPYLNGGFYGEVVEREGQVDPQPRAQGVRPSLPGLKGAKITGFASSKPNSYSLVYEVYGEKRQVNYLIAGDGSVTFTFVDSSGTRTETHQPRSRDGGRGQGGRGDPGQKQRPGGGGKGPPEGEARKPWIVAHASELDPNGDGIVSSEEVSAEAKKVFSAYDRDGDGYLSLAETEGRGGGIPKSPMGGFIRGHASEFDRNGDGKISAAEVSGFFLRFVGKVDANGDGRLTPDELKAAEARGPGGGGKGKGGKGGGGKNPRPESRPGDARRASPPERSPSPAPINPASRSTSSGDKPNFILIFIDDMGWRDVGFSGEKIAETPHLDRYAKQGVVFKNAYASAPNCAPSRACLLSGQYPPRHGVYTVVDERHAPGSPHHKITSARSSESMPAEIVTVAEVLKKAGYATGCFGMWNLGRGKNSPVTPTGQGFDLFLRPQDLGYEKHRYLKEDGSYLTDDFTDEALEFIDQAGGRPIFVYLPYHAIHAPFEPPADLIAKYQRKLQALDDSKTDPEYLASVEALDRNVGRIMADLEKRGIAKNTTVLFTSDNGGIPSRISPLKGSKGSLYEGGLKVPAVVWGYGVKASGQVCEEVVVGMDFYPTLVELAGLSNDPSHRPDGMSLVPLFRGEKSLERESLFWHFPCYIGKGSPSSVIRKGNLKLIHFFEDKRSELYDLLRDPNETNDLSESKVREKELLEKELFAWWKETGAALPSGSNPSFDPTAVSKRKGGTDGKNKGSKKDQSKDKKRNKN